MRSSFAKYLRNHYSELYKILLFLAGITMLVTLFPKEGKYRYEFQKGKPWLHADLIAPFDFAIRKPAEDLDRERTEILKNLKPYFTFSDEIYKQKTAELEEQFGQAWENKYGSTGEGSQVRARNFEACKQVLDSLLLTGILETGPEIENKPDDYTINVLHGNTSEEREIGTFFTIRTADEYIASALEKMRGVDRELLTPLLENALAQNVVFDASTTGSEKDNLLENISPTRGMVQMGQRIISKGELITTEKFNVLQSLKMEYEGQLGASSRQNLIMLGQLILVSVSLLVLALFLLAFRRDIFADNKKLVFILLLLFLMVLLTSTVIRYEVEFLYIVPLCLVPIIIRAFYDTRLALFIHIITLILIGFLVPNAFEFIFLQLIAGIITIISVAKLYRRSQFFITSVLIFITYSLIYIGMTLIQEGSPEALERSNFILFGGSAVLTLFAYPLIFVFEKTFGFVTDVSLMEFSDTNSRLLRKLAQKTPGTFQHSLQVANLAEEAIRAIGGKALLVRAGALYHDIGKMEMPLYFIENQGGGINPHDELTYEESARVIISHVLRGVELAKKHNLPEQIIDFIRTHHGTKRTEYFYTKQKQEFPDEETDESLFTYHGPIPFSRETCVLMMADSVEAASRSLKDHDEQKISNLVDAVIQKHLDGHQFDNSDITLKDISRIKRILKRKLLDIYHIRLIETGGE